MSGRRNKNTKQDGRKPKLREFQDEVQSNGEYDQGILDVNQMIFRTNAVDL